MCAAPSCGVDRNKLNALLEEVANDPGKMSNSTSCELQQTQMGTPENHMALDYLLAGQGGAWALMAQECCTALRDGFEGQQSGITLTQRAVEEWQKEENSSCWDWLHGCQIGGCCEMHLWQCLSSLQRVHLVCTLTFHVRVVVMLCAGKWSIETCLKRDSLKKREAFDK